MSNTAVEKADLELGPLEQKHLQYANFRAVANGTEVTKTHWHIALANGLGWGFDGMSSSMFSLISPLIIREFALDVPTYRSGLQVALLVGITGLYFWSWLADRYGRRTLLALNIALFSLMMPGGAGPDLCPLHRRTVGGELRAERRMVARIDAGGGDLAGAVARSCDQHQSRDMVPWCRIGRRHYRHRRRQLGLARRGDGAGDDRVAGDLCPCDLSEIAVLGARAGPQTANRQGAVSRRRAKR